MKLILLSGLSGSGKSVALHTLEDLGYFCIDNLPLFLLRELALGLPESLDAAFEHTAVGVDARSNPDQLRTLPDLAAAARARGIDLRVLFLDAQDHRLIQRYSETRRKHPLTRGERPLAEAIGLERALLEPIRACADICLDTTETNVHELRDLVRAGVVGDASPKASILLRSFGFKHGVPQDVDFVFDLRCLPNPHWQPELQPLTGLDPRVAEFLLADPSVGRMRDDLLAFFDHWVPVFETDGRSYLTIAVGCTGGQHRSVFMVETLRDHFERAGHLVLVRHRDLP